MEFLGNFLRNDAKFVEIPLVVAEISQFEFRQLVQFFDQTPISEGAYLQNYSPNFNKIKNLGFFTWALPAEVESSRTSLASRTHFEVLGLEASSPWPRSLRSSEIALSSTRGQHYFLNSWNFVGKRQKPRRKLENTFFVFRNWSIGLAKRASAPVEISPMTKMWQKSLLFLQFQFIFSVFFLHQ